MDGIFQRFRAPTELALRIRLQKTLVYDVLVRTDMVACTEALMSTSVEFQWFTCISV
jgi:hypothetical protein